jgi:short subunit dehydrogenase-like uncharacterized protein
MFTNIPWLLYGATGRTGTLVVEHAVSRGHRPTLAGRDQARLRALAERFDLPWVAGPVTELGRMIDDARLVLLAAGPFETTTPPALRACLDAGVHYLDIANEIGPAQAVLAAAEPARERGITALPAVGFGTVASDGLARHVADRLPGATRLDLAILLGTDGTSAGARASTMLTVAGGGRLRRDGRLVRSVLGKGARRLATPIGDRTVVPVPTGDLVVSGYTTGIPDITVSFTVPMPPIAARLAMPMLPTVARLAGTRTGRASTRRSAGPSTPGEPVESPVESPVRSYVWARAAADDGRSAEAWLSTGEGYAYSARSAVLAVEATLGAQPQGATTVARAFGSGLSIEAGGELLAAA